MDPEKLELRLGLAAYFLICCSAGCFLGSIQALWFYRVYVHEMFPMGVVLGAVGYACLLLASFQVPTRISLWMLRKA
jgi:hypothetical protein